MTTPRLGVVDVVLAAGERRGTVHVSCPPTAGPSTSFVLPSTRHPVICIRASARFELQAMTQPTAASQAVRPAHRLTQSDELRRRAYHQSEGLSPQREWHG